MIMSKSMMGPGLNGVEDMISQLKLEAKDSNNQRNSW